MRRRREEEGEGEEEGGRGTSVYSFVSWDSSNNNCYYVITAFIKIYFECKMITFLQCLKHAHTHTHTHTLTNHLTRAYKVIFRPLSTLIIIYIYNSNKLLMICLTVFLVLYKNLK